MRSLRALGFTSSLLARNQTGEESPEPKAQGERAEDGDFDSGSGTLGAAPAVVVPDSGPPHVVQDEPRLAKGLTVSSLSYARHTTVG